jgi:hypothetical protein
LADKTLEADFYAFDIQSENPTFWSVDRQSVVQTSSASSIASTMQQMSISFDVAMESLATALFVLDHAGQLS